VDVMVRDDGGWGCLLAEPVNLFLKVVDHVLISSGVGDEGSEGGLGNILEGFCASSSPEGLEDGEGGARGEGRGDLDGGCDIELMLLIHLNADAWWRYGKQWEH
jgi:hypothetical protein